jgi:hypothetical protein
MTEYEMTDSEGVADDVSKRRLRAWRDMTRPSRLGPGASALDQFAWRMETDSAPGEQELPTCRAVSWCNRVDRHDGPHRKYDPHTFQVRREWEEPEDVDETSDEEPSAAPRADVGAGPGDRMNHQCPSMPAMSWMTWEERRARLIEDGCRVCGAGGDELLNGPSICPLGDEDEDADEWEEDHCFELLLFDLEAKARKAHSELLFPGPPAELPNP